MIPDYNRKYPLKVSIQREVCGHVGVAHLDSVRLLFRSTY